MVSALEASNPPDCSRARLLTVDDQRTFLALLRDVARETDQLEVVGEAESGERAIELARQLQADMVLIDVRLPGMGGIEAATRIKQSRPSTVVVLISTTHPDELPEAADHCGADAVLWKNELEPRVLDEIWLRAQG
jgi:two-component system, NarL family, invasion response regulator UvrY